MQGSKIGLSPAEMELMNNREFILTKNTIQQKVVNLLSITAHNLQQHKAVYPEAHSTAPKISKGENYLGLPYAVLDYPRLSKENDLLFIRSFFWWGNFYSSTLHLAGSYKARHQKDLAEAWHLLKEKNYYVGINTNPWVHHFEAGNYREIRLLSQPEWIELITIQNHLKVAARWPLNTWEAAAENLEDSWMLLMRLIA